MTGGKKKICKIPAQICHKGESIEAHWELDASKLRRMSYNGKLFLNQNHSKEKSSKETNCLAETVQTQHSENIAYPVCPAIVTAGLWEEHGDRVVEQGIL